MSGWPSSWLIHTRSTNDRRTTWRPFTRLYATRAQAIAPAVLMTAPFNLIGQRASCSTGVDIEVISRRRGQSLRR